jgi:hypothetical protein
MKLYHGTNMDFDRIDVTKSKAYKDFGQGFYLTDIRSQAEDWAKKKTEIFGGTPVLQEYEFDESILDSSELSVLVFELPTEEWAAFIHNNRSRKTCFRHDYDIVVGPIADDGVAYLIGRYDEGTLTIADLVRELKYKKLNRQYFFGTEKAIKLLKRL